MAAINIPVLIKRVKELIPAYVPPDSFELPADDSHKSIREALSAIVFNSIISMKSYWTDAGLRIEDAKEFQHCIDSAKQTQLGSGAFGTVIKMPTRPCLSRRIPKGVKQVAIKIERLRSFWEYNQTPAKVREVFAIAKKAAALHIGPEMYDVFIVIGDDGIIKIVKVLEVVEGKAWENVVWKSPTAKAAAVKKLAECVRKMNKAGILHHDLHSANIMVTKKGEIMIIDYDLATFAKDEEQAAIGRINDSYSTYTPRGILSQEGINFLFQELVKDGTIILPGKKNVVTSNNNKNNKNKKTRKQKKREL
jgi:predicted Ser/Thr protein kinase